MIRKQFKWFVLPWTAQVHVQFGCRWKSWKVRMGPRDHWCNISNKSRNSHKVEVNIYPYLNLVTDQTGIKFQFSSWQTLKISNCTDHSSIYGSKLIQEKFFFETDLCSCSYIFQYNQILSHGHLRPLQRWETTNEVRCAS